MYVRYGQAGLVIDHVPADGKRLHRAAQVNIDVLHFAGFADFQAAVRAGAREADRSRLREFVTRPPDTGQAAEDLRAGLEGTLAAMTGPLRSTELIYCWDPDGPADPRGFARADHCDHIHWGMDA